MNMKNFLLTVATVCISGMAYAQHNMQQLSIGSKAPGTDKVLANVDGKPTTLDKAFTKNGLLVMFSCNTCPYVIRSQARTKEVMKYAHDKGIGMVIVNSNEAQRESADSHKEMEAYAKKQGYTVAYLADDDAQLADMFGATRTPEVFLFNGDRELVYKGAMEDNPSDPASSTKMFLANAMDNMLANKTIDPNSTKSVGCSIKRK